MKKIIHIVGARPNFIKLASVYAALAKRGFSQKIVHTGQHYDEKMSEVFFRELDVPSPDINLEVGSGTHAEQTAKVMVRFERLVLEEPPEWVLVYGDVNSTVAVALVCAKLALPLAHVEAGLRSFDRSMPEEINRVLTDQVADLLFTPSADADQNLIREGVSPKKIHLIGNVMIDTLVKFLPRARQLSFEAYPRRYALVTLHRPSNVDNNEILTKIFAALMRISSRLPIVFPVHPRTRQRLSHLVHSECPSDLHLIEPVGYLQFLGLEQRAAVVITDSGGIQEETTFLNVPCLTLRENTERPVTINIGTNLLIGLDYNRLEQEVDLILAGKGKKGEAPPLWDGKASERIADVMTNVLKR